MEKKIWEIQNTIIDSASDKGAETPSTKRCLILILRKMRRALQ